MEKASVGGIAVRWHDLVPGVLGLWLPERPDDLLEALDEAEFAATDERMPYFATLWPAGEALARAVLDAGDLAAGRVLDLGCGVGAVGLAAARRGARVTFLDWEPRSLDLVRASAARQGLPVAGAVAADWRRPPPVGAFDRVLAADVCYEARNVPAVAAFLAAHLAPAGEAWIADPRRPHAEALPAALEGAGLALAGPTPLPYRPRDVRVDLYRVRRPRSP